MSYISNSRKVIKKKFLIDKAKNIYRDKIKYNCPKCNKLHISEYTYKIVCPYCGNEENQLKIKTID